MSNFRVIVTDDRHGEYSIEKDILTECGAELEIFDCRTEEDVLEACRGADGVLLNLAPMSKDVIKKLDTVRVISRYGVGYDNVDPAACTAKGIYLANVPDYCFEDVSDLAVAHIFASLRQLSFRDRLIRNGDWNIGRKNNTRIRGKVLAIIGYGRSGRCLHRKMSAMGLSRVLVYDPYVHEEEIKINQGEPADFATAVTEADIISIHVPLSTETLGLFSEKEFRMMKPGAIIINTSRGGIIEHQSLVEALSENRIAFAGLDTHHIEPLPGDDPLLQLSNCVLSDHCGYNTEEGFVELKSKAAKNIVKVLTGGVPDYWLNPF